MTQADDNADGNKMEHLVYTCGCHGCNEDGPCEVHGEDKIISFSVTEPFFLLELDCADPKTPQPRAVDHDQVYNRLVTLSKDPHQRECCCENCNMDLELLKDFVYSRTLCRTHIAPWHGHVGIFQTIWE